MATTAMAVLMPPSTFHTAASTSRVSPCEIQCTVTSRVHLKCFQRFSAPGRGRHGDGGSDVFISARVLCKGVPVRSNSAGERVVFRPDIEPQSSADEISSSASDLRCTGSGDWFSFCRELSSDSSSLGRARTVRSVFRCNCTSHETEGTVDKEDSEKDAGEEPPSGGVAIAVKILEFYKREISPVLPGSCRFVPTCSEYGMQAFKKYGVVKGAILTAWRLSRCNPLGGSGFDPPRWFDEPRPPPF